jgi:hypothetical protein
MIDDQLSASVEQFEQARLVLGTLEDVVLLDPDHRQPAALGGKCVSRPGGLLLLDKQLLASSLPLVSGHDLRKIHCPPLSVIGIIW